MTIIQKGYLQLGVRVESADQKPSAFSDARAFMNRMRVAKLVKRHNGKTSVATRVKKLPGICLN